MQSIKTPIFSKALLKLALSCSLLVSFVSVTYSQAANAQNIALEYNFLLNGSSLGHIQTRIQGDKNGYRINSKTNAEGFASVIMGGDILQSCDFNVKNKSITPQEFFTEKKGSSSFKTLVTYDWKNRKISFNNGEKTLDMPKGYIVDNCNFHFAAAFTSLSQLKKQPIYVVDGSKQRLRGYQFISSNKEVIKTPAGEFNTTKMVFKREHNDKKKLTFWLAEGQSFYPIKFMDSRKKSNRTMLLKSVARS